MKVNGLNRKSFFLKTKAALHPHFVQSPVWTLKVMQVVNFITNEDGGMAKIGIHSRIESSSLGEVHDHISDVDTGHESQGN